MLAMRDLRLARDALRVQADLSNAANASAVAVAGLTLSPGTTSRFPISKHDLPLASSPALRAPPPIRWGSGPIPPGGGVAGSVDDSGASRVGVGSIDVSEARSEVGGGAEAAGANAGGIAAGAGAGAGSAGGVLVGRTQEMGIRFALDTLKYSEDEEVVVFMLHLVQVGGGGMEMLRAVKVFVVVVVSCRRFPWYTVTCEDPSPFVGF